MPGISVHAVDVARGMPAHGLKVEIFALEPQRRLIAEGRLSQAGVLDHAASRERLAAGGYEAAFHAGAYFEAAGVAQSAPPFLDVVLFRFNIADPAQHYHLPMKLTPWGFSLFRGS